MWSLPVLSFLLATLPTDSASATVVGGLLTRSADACANLTTITLTGITVNIATFMPAGSFFEGNTSNSDYNLNLTGLPSFCRVAAQINSSSTSTIHFEVWLPSLSTWNARFLAAGNGGWAGAINYPDISYGLINGFASMGTNVGHNSSSADGIFLLDTENSIDFGHRGMHLSIVNAKTVVDAYYSTPAAWSYYIGCSTGGREGMSEIQQYPEDFDGALIGAPVIWQTHLEAWENYVSKYQYPNTLETFISVDQWTTINTEVLNQCDALDGLIDGIISDSRRCHFVPEALLCSVGTSNSSCLTPPQIMNLKTLYAGWTDVNATLVFPGIPLGSELTGIQYYTNSATPGGFGADFYAFAITNDTNFDPTTITYADVQLADKINTYGAISDAFDPDIRAFKSKGGKIIHYHGEADSINNAFISPLYYGKVLDFFAGLPANDTASNNKVSDFYRLFSIPGMGHCSGGPGAWAVGAPNQVLPSLNNDTEHNALQALVKWTEAPTESAAAAAPTVLIGTKYLNETTVGNVALDLTVKMTRPNCLWPHIPYYTSGDANNASSWVCPKPLF